MSNGCNASAGVRNDFAVFFNQLFTGNERTVDAGRFLLSSLAFLPRSSRARLEPKSEFRMQLAMSCEKWKRKSAPSEYF